MFKNIDRQAKKLRKNLNDIILIINLCFYFLICKRIKIISGINKMKSYISLILLLSLLLFSCTNKEMIKTGEQIMVKTTLKYQKSDDIQYLLYIPKNYDSKDEWPLMLFLHGAGERGNDIEKLKVHGPPKLVDGGREFPFILVSPQCPEGEWWNTESLKALVEKLSSDLNVDKSRIYCTGLSMGGYGTFRLAAENPDLFAAIAPICGGIDPKYANDLKAIPAWVFHGAKDKVVTLDNSEKIVNAVNELGGKWKFTIYPDAGHDSWTETYDNKEFFKWILNQKLEKK